MRPAPSPAESTSAFPDPVQPKVSLREVRDVRTRRLVRVTLIGVAVRLLFAELYSGINTVGERVFDVSLEGAVPAEFAGIDPFAEAGPTDAMARTAQITAGDDLAFVHGLSRCGGTGPDGKEMSGWMRMTTCFRKHNGEWRIAHEHFSAPFDPKSDKALWLQP